MLPTPLRPHAAKDRLPQLHETGGRKARVGSKLDGFRAQAAHRVELKHRDVKRDPIQKLVAELSCKRPQIDVLIPDTEMEAQITNSAGDRHVVLLTQNLEEPEPVHASA